MSVAAVPRIVLLIMVVVISAQEISAQQSEQVTITEPRIYKLAELFTQADTVAVVKVVSGDAENYDTAVYKAQVIKSFKGAAEGETVYYGPYLGDRLGGEYVVFLRNATKPISPKNTSSAGFGRVQYGTVFDEGYSDMMVDYVCAFDGKEPAQHCDYGVRVCTDYIILPKSTPTFPPVGEDTPFGCRWVRKTVFVPLLEKLGSARK